MSECYLSRQNMVIILIETIKYLTISNNKIEIKAIITLIQRIILSNISSTISNSVI